MWRVDLHHHRQAYETCAPLFVLRHRKIKSPVTAHQRPSRGSVALLARTIRALVLGDEANDRIQPAVDVQPLAVAHAVAIGSDVDHVAEALRLRHTISGLLIRDHDQAVVRQGANLRDCGTELSAAHTGGRVDRIPQCHAGTRRNLDTVVTEGEYPHRLAHTTSHDRYTCGCIRPRHVGLP